MADCTLVIPLSSASSCVSLRLHRECLSAKSLFLRSLLSGVSPTDLIQSISPSRLHPSVPLHVPRNRLPRLLPSPSSHPIIFLPVPDPSSIQMLFEWMYFADTDRLQKALDQGDVQWQGLARNVEYLGLSTDIKVFLGHWYRNCSPLSSPSDYDDDDESDFGSEYDDEDDYHYSPSSSPADDEMVGVESDDECARGRTRHIKYLAARRVVFHHC